MDFNIERIRDDFPLVKHQTWLNSARYAPILRPVWESVKSCWEFLIHDSNVDEPDMRGEAAKMLHADKDEICWIARTTEGLNIVKSLIDLKRGDNIVVTDLGYPSNVFVWLPFREKGIEIRRIENREGDITSTDFEKAVDDNTKVVSISHTEWTSGLTYDLKELSDISHDHDAYLVADCCQSVGAVDVDCHVTELDFLVTSGHKWLCCAAGSGIFYIRGDLIDTFDPSYRFYHTVDEAFKSGPKWFDPAHDNIMDYDEPLLRSAMKFDTGCVKPYALWGLHSALKYLNDIGIENIQRRVRRLGGYLIDGLLDMGCNVNTPLEPERRHGLVTYSAGSHDLNKKIYEKLLANNVIVSIRYQGGIGGIRVSPHFFNTEAEIDKLLDIQKNVMI